jgi:two-component system chemotaxis response regulator CheB
MTIGVLIVDDSRFVRRRLAGHLDQTRDIRVIAEAGDPYEARQALLDHSPDVMILDINMPRMDGLTFLELVMSHHPLPVIVLSAAIDQEPQLAREARRLGAAAVIAKPHADSVDRYHEELLTSIRQLGGSKPDHRAVTTSGIRNARPPASGAGSAASSQLLAIGASTGGTEAIRAVLAGLPASVPGTVIVQHMPANFTTSFAERLDQSSSLSVVEARGGETLQQGHAYLAPGGYHLVVRRAGSGFRLELDEGPRIHYQRPALDVTFKSIAEVAGPRALGVILTGMGRDGADGLLAMRKAGARTLGQDEASCVVYGMPRVAWECGAVEQQCPLDKIADMITKTLPRVASC